MGELTESVKGDELSRRVGGRKLSSQAINLQFAIPSPTEMFFAVNLGNNAELSAVQTLRSTFDLRMMGMIPMTFYAFVPGETATDADRVPYGDNISDGEYLYQIHIDWGASDNKNVKIVTWFRNQSGDTKKVALFGNARYIVEEAGI